ncbi:hypothetical protein BC936DRAFT_147071 [Jimgerdemannia flammicorona]|nr:hypothetical protein BC936DRAFT_147071 [Jimgerdemannia flammicorona]
MSTTTQDKTTTVVLGYLKAMESWDAGNLAPFMDDSYVHHTHPTALGLPDRNKQEYIEHWRKTVIPMFKTWDVVVAQKVSDGSKVTLLV